MTKFLIERAAVVKLADIICAIDHEQTTPALAQLVEDAHNTIIEMLGENASLLYGDIRSINQEDIHNGI